MTTKQNLANGEEALKQVTDTLTALAEIDDALGTPLPDDAQGRATKFLISIQLIEFESRKQTITIKLAKLRKEYVLEFEKQSIEANNHMPTVIAQAKPFIGKPPLQITELIAPLIEYCEEHGDDITQEDRNEVYFKLKGHVNFMQKTYKE